MIALEFRVDTRKALRDLEADRREVAALHARAFRRVVMELVRAIKLRIRRLFRIRTGGLWKSVRATFHASGARRWAVVSVDAPYAGIQESGGRVPQGPIRGGKRVIRGRRVSGQIVYGRSAGKRLFIPGDILLTRAGRAKDVDKTILSKAGSNPFSIFVRRNALLMSVRKARPRVKGRRRSKAPAPKIIFLAALVKRVQITGKHYVRDSVAEVRARQNAIVEDELKKFRGAR